MSRVRNRDSVAELAIRKRLWAMGLRFRLHTDLPGRPDIVFTRQRLAIFVDGDFWHGNAWRVRGLPSFESQFANRSQWWIDKIRKNMARDEQVSATLRAQGWRVTRVWESEVLADPNGVAAKLAELAQPGLAMPVARAASYLERRRLASVTAKEYREAYTVADPPSAAQD
jgi:DNA mismatch endonuclease, patch repair protein